MNLGVVTIGNVAKNGCSKFNLNGGTLTATQINSSSTNTRGILEPDYLP